MLAFGDELLVQKDDEYEWCTPGGRELAGCLSAAAGRGCAAPALQRVADAVKEALATEGMAARLQQIGVDAIGSTPRELADTLRADMAVWSEAAKAAKLKME
jgi:tripartite-type tricarboxylate transporter receptor subunit TctC